MSKKVPQKYPLIKEHAVNINSLTLQLYQGVSLLFDPILSQMLLLLARKLDGHQIRHM